MSKPKKIIIGDSENKAKKSAIFKVKSQEKLEDKQFKEAKVDTTWEGQSLETPNTRLEDDAGVGKKIIIRRFEFGLRPLQKGEKAPSNQQLLEYFKPQVFQMLWKDGWTQCEAIRTLLSKDHQHFYIFVPAEATGSGSNSVILETPLTLKQILHG